MSRFFKSLIGIATITSCLCAVISAIAAVMVVPEFRVAFNFLLSVESLTPSGSQLRITPAATTVIQTADFRVFANVKRNETDFYVDPGDIVTIEYLDGKWQAGLSSVWPLVDALGDNQVPFKSGFPVENANIMTLVAGIGEYAPFAVGKLYVLRCNVGGRLWLSANDDNFSDNNGSLTVRIKIAN